MRLFPHAFVAAALLAACGTDPVGIGATDPHTPAPAEPEIEWPFEPPAAAAAWTFTITVAEGADFVSPDLTFAFEAPADAVDIDTDVSVDVFDALDGSVTPLFVMTPDITLDREATLFLAHEELAPPGLDYVMARRAQEIWTKIEPTVRGLDGYLADVRVLGGYAVVSYDSSTDPLCMPDGEHCMPDADDCCGRCRRLVVGGRWGGVEYRCQ